MIEEIWKDIEGYEGLYQVSNLGNVKSLDKYVNGRNSKRLVKGKLLSLFDDKDGYKLVNLYNNKKIKQFRVHILVANAFIPNPNELPQVNHIDGDKSNNFVDNLEWCDCLYNIHHALSKGLFRKTSVNQYDLDGNFIKKWDRIIQVERELNIFHSRIIEVCKGTRNQIGGYKWRYAKEDDVK